MGRAGSSSRNCRQRRKPTVEDSLSVSVSEFHGRFFEGADGALSWSQADGGTSSAGWFISWACGPTLTLHYCWQDHEGVRIPIRLQMTPMRFGGQRWWFTCPLVVNGVACGRRVGKLHLAPGAKYFGCRTCHGLTYRSCQEAHAEERRIAASGLA